MTLEPVLHHEIEEELSFQSGAEFSQIVIVVKPDQGFDLPFLIGPEVVFSFQNEPRIELIKSGLVGGEAHPALPDNPVYQRGTVVLPQGSRRVEAAILSIGLNTEKTASSGGRVIPIQPSRRLQKNIGLHLASIDPMQEKISLTQVPFNKTVAVVKTGKVDSGRKIAVVTVMNHILRCAVLILQHR